MDLRPSSFSYAFTYDVFLSFRGPDTRHGFTGNLYKAFYDKGIHTFIDDEKLRRGDEITPSLMKAIKESRIAIPVFSINYASSSFCLDELVNIMKRKDILVLPIFYNVDPSDVRHQKSSYGKALANHEKKFKANKEKLEEWKMTLRQAANLSGYHFEHGKEYEYEFIGKIVNLVSNKINRLPLHVADYPIGLESQIQEVKKLLDLQPDKGVNMVGIHGPGGMGKTTLAIAIYNLIADHFDGLCFLEDVRANSEKHGLPHLQSILLSEIVGEKEIKLASVKQGMSIIKHRLQTKKVLLVLDDVNEKEQLEAIVGGLDWFGHGSIVIITTLDKQLLTCHKVEKTYEVKELNKEDALQLIRWKAFKSEQVDPSYLDVLNRAVTYASGLPLALEVIGSNLYGQSIEEWDSALKQYAKIPNNKILEILKKSYDALEEEEKSVFLDIACCFKGYHLEEVNEMLCAHHGDNMKHHIRVLVDKSLIKIVNACQVTLHDLIEEMGKEIVRRESPKLEKRSRLWFHEDVVQVLKNTEEFVNLTNLNFDYCEHLAQIPDVSCLRSLERLSFGWCKNLHMIHNSVGSLKKLKSLFAWACSKLRSFPPLEMTSLENLRLSFCERLESFPETSVEMENITQIGLQETPMIKEIPRSFQNLTQLNSLSLQGPWNLDWDLGSSLIERILTMPKLISNTAEKMEGWAMPKEDEGEKKVSSSNVEFIRLKKGKLMDEFFLAAAKLFPNLKDLTLKHQNLTTIPECIKECRSLQRLELRKCTLQEIRGIPPNLKTFKATNCPSLTASCRSMLLKQELHEAGDTVFILPLTPVPEWFEHRSEGTSLSFWFRNRVPRLLLCLALPKFQPMPEHGKCHTCLLINGINCSSKFEVYIDHTNLFHLNKFFRYKAFLENGWNRAEVIFLKWNIVKFPYPLQPIPGLIVQGGIHVLKEESSMEDIRFTDPCRKRKLEDDLDISESQNHLKKHRLADMEVVGTQIVPQSESEFCVMCMEPSG